MRSWRRGRVSIVAAIDDLDAQVLVQQLVVHHKVDDGGRHARVVQGLADHQPVVGALVIAQLPDGEGIAPHEARAG